MVSMRDVARDAQVSVATVSAIINGADCVKRETREKVLRSIRALGYVPNQSARGLAARKTFNLGIVSMIYPDSQEQSLLRGGWPGELSYYPFINSIIKSLEGSGYGILLENFCYTPDSFSLPSIIEQQRVDGAFILGSLYTEEFITQVRQKLDKVVAVGCNSMLTDHVQNNYEESIAMAIRYLVENGHRHIAYACGDSLTNAYRYKLRGYIGALEDAGIQVNSSLLFPSKFSAKAGYEIARKLFDVPGEKPTALICASDILAAGAYQYFYEQGIRVPEHISVVGYENMIIGRYMLPALTTIDWDKPKMASEACRLMMTRLKAPNTPIQSVEWPCAIVERKSVKRILP